MATVDSVGKCKHADISLGNLHRTLIGYEARLYLISRCFIINLYWHAGKADLPVELSRKDFRIAVI